jgi:cytochrome P450
MNRTWASYLPWHFAGLDLLGTGYAAREKLFAAFRTYSKRVPGDASSLIKENDRAYREARWGGEDIARHHAILSNGVFSNTSPSLYWAIHDLYSRPDVVYEVRNEILTNAVGGNKETGFTLDMAAVKQKCILLLSTYQETQRLRHTHANIRAVLQDTVLDDNYLLKKGSLIQLPPERIHADVALWGPTAAEFDPYRFVKKRLAPGFLAWGAPPHLCPARQFAAVEVLVVLALLVVRVDLEPVGSSNGAGAWKQTPPPSTTATISTLPNPQKDLEITVTVRDEWVGEWTLVNSGDSRTKVPLAST